MARNQFLSLFSVFFVFFISLEFINCSSHNEENKQIYIVYMGAIRQGEVQPLSAYYSSILQGVGVSKESLVRIYTKSFRGFAVYLTENEQKALAAHDEVVSVFLDTDRQLLTTNSWDFMGFPINVSRNPTFESDIIVGVLDSGIWPASASFDDTRFGPPPKKWKGVCSGGKNFTCNNKIIGARVHTKFTDSALDSGGHGTHTASTLAGNQVTNASYFGIANGTARGAVPSARIAVYKVCGIMACRESDILSAFDDAISDGVDILSVSLGGDKADPFKEDAVAIGSLHAFLNGILTVQAAGNSFQYGTVCSVAPWLFTVAASSTSRHITNKVQLGNGNEKYGYTINSFDLDDKKFPLIHSIDASNSTCRDDFNGSRGCECLDSEKVKGKIVLCYQTVVLAEISSATGAIVKIPDNNDESDTMPCPASFLQQHDFELVESYYNSTKNPEASIFKSQLSLDETAPVVASFSSRGPNRIVPDILKPDITAPGISILAAFPPNESPTFDIDDTRSTPYSIFSGTSMACPHVAGAAAYVKSFHPDWSTSAIKSALMTTAKQMNPNQSRDGTMEFAFGSGFLDPVKALNPGLVYENTKTDYVELLCNIGYDKKAIGVMFGDNTTCPNRDTSTPKDLNYPTMSAKLKQTAKFSITFNRTVTNVGEANSTYKATVSQIPQVNITVEPSVLTFKGLNEKQSFVVTVSKNSKKKEDMMSASLEWSDGIHVVRSPIVIYRKVHHTDELFGLPM